MKILLKLKRLKLSKKLLKLFENFLNYFVLTLLCHGIESTLLGWFYDLIFTCCLCAGNSLFIESTQKGRFYGSKSSRPGYMPRQTFFIESTQIGRFYESEPARPWLYRQKLLIRDICPSFMRVDPRRTSTKVETQWGHSNSQSSKTASNFQGI
jgi:hypothetical protein